MYVRIYRKGWNTKGLCHHYSSCFMSYCWELLQFLIGLGNFALMFFQKYMRKAINPF